MHSSDKDFFVDCIRGYFEAAGKTITKRGVETWWEMFREYEFHDFRSSCREASRQARYSIFTPNDVLCQLKHLKTPQTGSVSAEYAEEQIKNADAVITALLPKSLQDDAYGLMRFLNSTTGRAGQLLQSDAARAQRLIDKTIAVARKMNDEDLEKWPSYYGLKYFGKKEPSNATPRTQSNPVKPIRSITQAQEWGHARH